MPTPTPPLMRDPSLPHQIVLNFVQGRFIAVSCNCRYAPGGGGGYIPIEARTLFPAADAMAAWRGWHARQGITRKAFELCQ
jgi:hypothetical protein